MKKITKILLTMVVACSIFGCSKKEETEQPTEDATVYRVAIIEQFQHPSLDEIAAAIEAELDRLAQENDVTIIYNTDFGNMDDASVVQQFAAQYIAEEVDAIIPIATFAAQTMAAASKGTGIPVIYGAITDPEGADLTGLDDVMITGTSDALNTNQIMDMMFELQSDITKVGLLYSTSETNSAKAIEEAKAYLDGKGVEYVEATGNNDAEVSQAVASLIAAGVNAVFTPQDNIVANNEIKHAQDFIEAGIPHYTGADSFVRNGAFATCGVNYTDLGTRTADLAFEALTKGMDGLEDYYLMDGGIITVNKETAEKLNITNYANVFSKYGEVVEVETTRE